MIFPAEGRLSDPAAVGKFDHVTNNDNDAKITAGLDKKDDDRVVGSGFRAADELGMVLAGTLKPATSRFGHGMVSNRWLKEHRSTQKWDTGQFANCAKSLTAIKKQ